MCGTGHCNDDLNRVRCLSYFIDAFILTREVLLTRVPDFPLIVVKVKDPVVDRVA